MKRTIQHLFKKGESNIIKILCLSMGLAVGLTMLAEVIYERSYDIFLPHLEDTYQIHNQYQHNSDKESQKSYTTSGAIAPGIKEYCPEVEAATRFTLLNIAMNLCTEKDFVVQGNAYFCDTAFFKVFPRNLLLGEDPSIGLGKANQAYISSEMMKKLGKDIVGKKLKWKEFPDFQLTIAGVFEAFPENTHLPHIDIAVALPTIGQVAWDGTNNWMGNDRYTSYLRLMPGTSPEQLQPNIQQMIDNHMEEDLKKYGCKQSFLLYPVKDLFSISNYNRIMNLIFLAFGLIMLTVAILNYILLVISDMVKRAKSIATYRCYGAESKHIYQMILKESFLHCFISFTLAILLILSLQDFLQEQIGHSLKSLFPPTTILICLGVVTLVTLLCGIMPGYLYMRIPITYAYRRYTENKRMWKLGLLFTQFMLTSFFVCIITVIGLQYHSLTNFQTGFEYHNLLYVSLPGTTQTERERCIQELKKHPNVEGITWGYQEMFFSCSGNNVYMQGKDEPLFNIADMYTVGPDYHQTFNIPVIEGHTFTPHLTDTIVQEIMVSRSFVDQMRAIKQWGDESPIGKNIHITEHPGLLTICGVYENIWLGSQISESHDPRPTVMFYRKSPNHFLYIRVKDINAPLVEEIQRIVTQTMPSQEKKVYSLNMEMTNLYQGVEHIRNSIFFAGVCILIIALIGLIAYIKDEVNRRRSEIAIRIIHGASIGNTEKLFLGDLLKTALPAALIGVLAAWLVSNKILELFTSKIDLTILLFGTCMLSVLLVIFSLAAWLIYQTSQANPTENLQTE